MSEPLLKSMSSTSDRAALSLEVMVTITTQPPLSDHLKVGEQGVGLFEQGDELAHRLAEVLVAHPEQGILTRGRWDSSKGGWLERAGGKRHLVANHLWCKLNKSKVSAARAACRHCLGAIGESSRSCRAPRYISTISTSLQHVPSIHVEK